MSSAPPLDVRAQPSTRRSARARAATAIRRRPLEAFFVLTFAISWLPALSYLATGAGPAILSCGPAIAAFAVLGLTRGRAGTRGLLRSMLAWRVPARWWAFAILAPIGLSALATALNVAFGAPAPNADDLARWTAVVPTVLLILLVPLIGGAWEEPGWRGYALPRLLARRSPLAASLVLGVVWAVWHIPVFLVGDQHWSDLLLVVAVTVVLTWLFQNALGSVLVAMVFHALNNAISGEYLSPMFEGADSVRQSWMLVIVWSAVAALVAVFARGFRGSPPAR